MAHAVLELGSLCESLAADLSEQLRKTHSFIVTGPQYVLNRAMREGIEAGMTGDNAGLVLWISLGDLRMASMRRMMHEVSATSDLGKWLQLTSPSILVQLMSRDTARFLSTIRQCRRFLVWLQPVDLADCALLQWLQIYQQIPADHRAGVTYFWPYSQAPDWSLIRSIHGDIPCTDLPFNTTPIQPNVEFVPSAAAESYTFSGAFKERCQSCDTLVSCRFGKTRMHYAEWSHLVHVHVFGRDTEKLQHDHAHYQFGVNSGMSAFIHDDRTFEQVVALDPTPDEDVTDLANSWGMNGRTATIVATSKFELLAALARRPGPEDAPQPRWLKKCYQAFRMFAALSRYETMHLLPTDDHTLADNLLQYWASQDYIAQNAPYSPTAKSRALFPGIQQFDMLADMLNYKHETPCESPGHQFCAYLSSEFLRLRIASRFVLSGESWQRHFHHVLQNESIIRPESAPVGTAWLDAMPCICTLEHTAEIEKLLYSQQIPATFNLSLAAGEALAGLQKAFADAPAHHFLETTNGAACWWTFAGAGINHMLAILLKSLAPKLSISYGNLCLRMMWVASRGNTELACKRFEMLIAQIEGFAQHPHTLPDGIRTEYLQNHPLNWLLPLMPPSLADELFADFTNALAQVFANGKPPVVATDLLHQIDALPYALIVAAPEAAQNCPDRVKKNTGGAQHITESSKESHPNTASAGANGVHCRNDNPTLEYIQNVTPVIPGVMHTRYPWIYIDNEPALNRAINIILKQPCIGLDVETTLYHQNLCLIQIGCSDRSFIIDPLRVNFYGLEQVFSNPQIIKIIHNATFEKTVLRKYGMQIINIVDTMHVSQKIYGKKYPNGHSLKAVCMREFGIDMDKTNQTSRWDLRPLTPEQLEYAALDAEILIHLYRHFCTKKGFVPRAEE